MGKSARVRATNKRHRRERASELVERSERREALTETLTCLDRVEGAHR
jgi:hypothetical protein